MSGMSGMSGTSDEITSASDHQAAVQRLVQSYEQIPPGSPVRLAKQTSNLFRPRARVDSAGLDVSGLNGVISVDPQARTADVQGMCTYEDLVDATLSHALMPLVVPQLRTITLGGAVSGLGIESSSFRNGLPHESVLELDVLTGAGEIVTARPDGEHADLFRTFPNSYGTLGYATRLRIELEPVLPYVGLRHVCFTDLDLLSKAIDQIVESRVYDEQPVDFIDGVVFDLGRTYLTLARWLEETPAVSDYTRQQIYYRSIDERETDALTAYDYLWRWDTDWFWCSAAFGAQNPKLRRLWPRRYRRSDVYYRMVALENRYQLQARLNRRRGRPERERVIQDVELPVNRLADFLRWFDPNIGMRPVWLCPIKLRDPHRPGWPLYPLDPDGTYVNVGFWGTVPIAPGAADGDLNKAIEAAVTEFGGHKSLYSDAYYDRETFNRLYNGAALDSVKQRYDPDHRLTGLYEKAVRRR
jgi:FAD/FMN-containing dehydrogenase